MFPSFHPLLLPCAGNFPMHKSILREPHLKSHHLPTLTGPYSTLNGIKYFIVTCTVIDTEVWLCLDKNVIQCFMPDCLFNILRIHPIFSDLLHSLCVYVPFLNRVLPRINLIKKKCSGCLSVSSISMSLLS